MSDEAKIPLDHAATRFLAGELIRFVRDNGLGEAEVMVAGTQVRLKGGELQISEWEPPEDDRRYGTWTTIFVGPAGWLNVGADE